MSQTKEALRVALSAAERLSLRLRRELAEQLLASTAPKQKPKQKRGVLDAALRLRRELEERSRDSAAPEQKTVTVRLRRLPLSKQSRLGKLLDKNNEGKITKAERAELQRLGEEVDETMLSNSMALARAARPELFDGRGRPIKSRVRQARGRGSTRVKGVRREKTHR